VELLGSLVLLALAEDGGCFVVDGDDTRAAALGGPVDTLAADDGRRSGDGDLLGVEVDARRPLDWRYLAACGPDADLAGHRHVDLGRPSRLGHGKYAARWHVPIAFQQVMALQSQVCKAVGSRRDCI